MPKESKVINFFKEAGYEPLDNRCIVVSYAPVNMSDTISKLLWNDSFCVLQICKDLLVLAPLKASVKLQKDEMLEIPFQDISSITVEETGFNYHLLIRMKNGTLRLSVQQKELSSWRCSGWIATDWGLSGRNWHKENMDETLKALQQLGK